MEFQLPTSTRWFLNWPIVKPPSRPFNLAPSPRILAWMLKRGRVPPSAMALTVVEPPPVEPEVFEIPPSKAITPCDPWPRPYYLEGGLRRVRNCA